MAKEKLSANPVLAQRKAEKAKALKKGKAQLQAQRNEKLARRNPDRLQRQIDDLRSAESSSGLRPKDRETLAQLEKDLRAVQKARETLGDKAPHFSRRRDDDDGGNNRFREPRRDGRGGGVLGKRRRDGGRSDSSDTDEDVRDIPMPRDTPPPIPRKHHHDRRGQAQTADNENDGPRAPHALPPKPEVVAKTVYSSAPVVRDLRKEAVSKFVPSSVQRKPKLKAGEGGSNTLQNEALKDAEKVVDEAGKEAEHRMMAAQQEMVDKGASRESQPVPIDLAAEEARFEREMRQVEIEEVSDEDL